MILNLKKNYYLEINDFHPDPSEIQLFYEDTDSIIERLSPRIYFEFEDLDYWRSKIIEKQGTQNYQIQITLIITLEDYILMFQRIIVM